MGPHLQLAGGAVPAAMLVFVRLPEREVIYSCWALREFEWCVELYELCRFPSVFSNVVCTMMVTELESYSNGKDGGETKPALIGFENVSCVLKCKSAIIFCSPLRLYFTF